MLGRLPEKSNHPLTILFSVGGAGAQKEIGLCIARSLTPQIRNKEIKIILVGLAIRENLEKLILKPGLKKFASR